MFRRIQNLISSVCGVYVSGIQKVYQNHSFQDQKIPFDQISWLYIKITSLSLQYEYLLFDQIVCLRNAWKHSVDHKPRKPSPDRNLFQSRTATSLFFFFFFFLKTHWAHNIRHSLCIAGFAQYSPVHKLDQLLFHLIFLGLFYVVLVLQHSFKKRHVCCT